MSPTPSMHRRPENAAPRMRSLAALLEEATAANPSMLAMDPSRSALDLLRSGPWLCSEDPASTLLAPPSTWALGSPRMRGVFGPLIRYCYLSSEPLAELLGVATDVSVPACLAALRSTAAEGRPEVAAKDVEGLYRELLRLLRAAGEADLAALTSAVATAFAAEPLIYIGNGRWARSSGDVMWRDSSLGALGAALQGGGMPEELSALYHDSLEYVTQKMTTKRRIS